MAACGERRGVSIYASDAVVCPKPRRISLLNPSINDQIRPSRCRQMEISDTAAGAELLDIILTRGDKFTNQVASSPPFFSGSPPSRASNPLIQDSQFGCDGVIPLSPAVPVAISPSSARRGSCAWAKFGQKPAVVRIEGFDCLSRDCRSISAVA